MASLASINIKFVGDLAQFSDAMQKAQRKIGKMGKNLSKVGKNLSLGVTAPLLGVAGGALKAAADLETLETSLTVMTGSAEEGKRVLKDLSDFTASTPFQLEQVGKAAKQLLAFGFSVDQVKKDLKTLGDVSAGSGNQIGDVAQIFGQVSAAGKLTGERFNQLQERAIPIGSAIAKTMGIAETEVKEFITKGKVGVEEFTAAFNSLATEGGLFAGAMEKQSQTLAGLFSTLKDNIQLAFGELGIAISESVNLKGVAQQLTTQIQAAVKWFKELSPATKKFIVIFSGIAAAIGPLLALAGTILPAIGTGLAFLSGPIGLIVAGLTAVGVIIYKNWQPIKATLVSIANYFVDLYNESTVFRFAVDAVAQAFRNMYAGAKFIFNALVSILKTVVTSFVEGFKIIGKVIKGALTLDADLIKEAWEDYKKAGLDATTTLVKDLKSDWAKLQEDLSGSVQAGLEEGAERAKIELKPDQVDTSAATGSGKSREKATAITGNKSGVLTFDKERELLEKESQRIGSLAAELRDKLLIYPNDNEAKQQLAQYEATLAGFKARLEGSLVDIPETVDNANQATSKLFTDIGPILEGAAEAAIEGFASMTAGLILGTASVGDVFKGLIGLLADVAIQIGKAAVKIGVTMAAVQLSFSNPLAAIAAGAGLILVGQLMKGLASSFGGGSGGRGARVPALASGGIATGPTLALVGEYPGASSNPEVIAPLDKLKTMIQPQGGDAMNITGAFKIEGRDLKLALENTDKTLYRTS